MMLYLEYSLYKLFNIEKLRKKQYKMQLVILQLPKAAFDSCCHFFLLPISHKPRRSAIVLEKIVISFTFQHNILYYALHRHKKSPPTIRW